MAEEIVRRLNPDTNEWETVLADVTGGSLPSGGTTGEVLTKLSNAEGDADWEASGGGSSSVRLVAVPFAFDSPGLYTAAGFPLLTVAEGDIVLDFWFSVATVWNAGATPSGDAASAADLLVQAGFYKAAAGSGWDLSVTDGVPGGVATDAVIPNNVTTNLAQAFTSSGSTSVPRTYLADTEIVVQAWDDSVQSEGDPAPFGATTGAATAYLLIATPAAP